MQEGLCVCGEGGGDLLVRVERKSGVQCLLVDEVGIHHPQGGQASAGQLEALPAGIITCRWCIGC